MPTRSHIQFDGFDVPLSFGVATQDAVFVSGQVAADLDTGDFTGGDVADQTRVVLKNIFEVLERADAAPEDIVKTTVLLTDIDQFDEMNRVYGEILEEPYPARSAFEVGALAGEFEVEIEAIAIPS